MSYVELQVTSNFTFLEGGSHPNELVLTASLLGMKAIAFTDRNSVAGIVRAHGAAKQVGIRLLVGARLDLCDSASLLCFPTDRAAYGRLCRLLTVGKRRAAKGECDLTRADVKNYAEGQILVALPPQGWGDSFARELKDWVGSCPGHLYLAGHWLHRGDDRRRLQRLAELAQQSGAPLVATNDVLYHLPERRPLQDVLSCIREGMTIDKAGWKLLANAERHLKAPEEMARLFTHYPDAIARTIEIADRCRFSLDELRYEYPEEGENGEPPQARLERLTWEGARCRYPNGIPDKVRATLEKEIALIRELDYAPYFLTVHGIVTFARGRKILCQGRGSAANSVVCYCLGITSVDPTEIDLLFERFLSAERREPPDIDVDFEHERREEVIQHIYEKYGRDRAGLAATVIHYRSRMAIRDVGKAMGLSEDITATLANSRWGSSGEGFNDNDAARVGLKQGDPRLARTLELASELIGFPRHLSQHVGGFVISRGRLDELVPIENAAMQDRTVICWDKDDLDELKLMKVDVLALGMLSCLRRGFDLLKQHKKQEFSLATIPQGDSDVYDMICKADTIGAFQIESRAQMSMLPRLKPREFYDLVIEVAIVRPGPIQGDMVHPYLKQRFSGDPIVYPSPELESVLYKTCGVPLFQEQAMKIAIVAAGFSGDEANQLRRAMATFRHAGTMGQLEERFIDGMARNGYELDFAQRCFNQIKGFGDYGFPESHAASFALLAYASSWMKCRHPDVFACAILNSQPMGFYAAAQLVRDAHEHGVEVRPVDVNLSDWDCTLEPLHEDRFALRLGLRQVTGFSEDNAKLLVNARGDGYATPHDLWRRSGLNQIALEKLAAADGFRSVGLSRRNAIWAIRSLGPPPLPLFEQTPPAKEPNVSLPLESPGEEVIGDYVALQLSLKSHPMALLRQAFAAEGVIPSGQLLKRSGGKISVAGLVLNRQRPATSKGVIFMTLEDESGIANIVVWEDLYERARAAVLCGRLLRIDGDLQREGDVIHIVAKKITDHSARLFALTEEGYATPHYRSRDFH